MAAMGPSDASVGITAETIVIAVISAVIVIELAVFLFSNESASVLRSGRT